MLNVCAVKDDNRPSLFVELLLICVDIIQKGTILWANRLFIITECVNLMFCFSIAAKKKLCLES